MDVLANIIIGLIILCFVTPFFAIIILLIYSLWQLILFGEWDEWEGIFKRNNK